MPKKASRKTQRNKADKLWSEIIRSKGACEVCKRTKNLNPHHIVGRRNLVLRHDIRNGCLLCAGCHIFKRESAHQDNLWFMEWFKKVRPKDYKYLMLQRCKIEPQVDYDKILKKLKKHANCD